MERERPAGSLTDTVSLTATILSCSTHTKELLIQVWTGEGHRPLNATEVSPALGRGLGQVASEGPFQPKLLYSLMV